MARMDLACIKLVREDISGVGHGKLGIKPYEVTPALPTPLSELFADSFSQMQLQLGVALKASRDFPYFRAVLAEQLLTDVEEYCRRNAIRSDALGTFLSMYLYRLAGANRFFNDLVWKDLTIAVHWAETPNDDAPPAPMPGEQMEKVERESLIESTEKLVSAIAERSIDNNGGTEERLD